MKIEKRNFFDYNLHNFMVENGFWLRLCVCEEEGRENEYEKPIRFWKLSSAVFFWPT